MIQELVKQYLACREEVDAREAEWAEAKALCGAAEEKLAKAMIFSGIRSQKQLDGSLVFLAPEIFASKKSEVPTEALIAALRKCGLGDLVSETYQIGSLKSWAKENWEHKKGDIDVASEATPEDWDASLPEPLRGMLNVFQRTRVRVRGKPAAPSEAGELEHETQRT